MPSKYQTFEQPLNERIRMCLRIETLMKRFHYFEALKGDWSTYNAILGILEVTALVERGDFKQELMKELERQHISLNALANHDAVDKSKLNITLGKHKDALAQLHTLDGKLGEHLKRVEFLQAIKQRTSIPGGSCDFDLPELRYWLNKSYDERLSDLDRWVNPYVIVESAVSLVLTVIRDSALPQNTLAEKGFYQQSLDPQQSNQLLRLNIDSSLNMFPEVSAGKHRYSIRFLSLENQTKDSTPSQVKDDVSFLLSRCSL